MMQFCLSAWRIIGRLPDVDRMEREIDSLLDALEAAEYRASEGKESAKVTRSRLQDVEGWLRDAEERRRRAEESLRAAEHRALKAEGALEEARKILDEIEDLYPWVLPEVTSEMLRADGGK